MASVVEPQNAPTRGPNGNFPTPTAPAPGKPTVTVLANPAFAVSAAAADEEPLFPDDDARSLNSDGEEGDGTTASSPVNSPASMTAPPWWQAAQAHTTYGQSATNGRNFSNLSTESVVPAGGITMRDNEVEDEEAGRNSACWARGVQVTDWVVVNSSTTNIGAFVVWNIRVETLNGSYMNIRKRYSEFDGLRKRLMATFPDFEAAVPTLPPKSVIWKFQHRFLEKRRRGLQYFLNCILLNPEFSGSPVLKEFLFA